MMRSLGLLVVLSAVCSLLSPSLFSQDGGTKSVAAGDRSLGQGAPARDPRRRKPDATHMPLEQILEQLEAAPAEPPVDVVRLRLLRNEIRRWIRDDTIPDEDSFDEWAFGDEQGENRFRQQLDKLLLSKLEKIDRVFQLTEQQRRKVKLAGHGDIKHLLTLVDQSRVEFQRAVLEIGRLPELQKLLLQIDLRVSNGPFEAGSILAKTLRKMFDEERIKTRPATTVR